jgi:hypothetical protein
VAGGLFFVVLTGAEVAVGAVLTGRSPADLVRAGRPPGRRPGVAQLLGAVVIIFPSGATTYQTLPTPWPVTSPGALSFWNR